MHALALGEGFIAAHMRSHRPRMLRNISVLRNLPLLNLFLPFFVKKEVPATAASALKLPPTCLARAANHVLTTSI